MTVNSPVPALVNGEPFPDAHGTALDALVASLVPGSLKDGSPQGVAVALNDAVVPRGSWPTTVVAPGDRVEVVTAVQGG